MLIFCVVSRPKRALGISRHHEVSYYLIEMVTAHLQQMVFEEEAKHKDKRCFPCTEAIANNDFHMGDLICPDLRETVLGSFPTSVQCARGISDEFANGDTLTVIFLNHPLI